MKSRRRHITVRLSQSSADFVRGLAKKDKVRPSTKAAQLIEMGLDEIEDLYWSKRAEEIEGKTTGYISSEEFWKRLLPKQTKKASELK